jgi:hypothetical protein
MNKHIALILKLFTGAWLFVLPLVTPAQAADHAEPPLVAELPSSNIADFYVFRNPGDNTQLVTVITFDPFVPAGTTVSPFNEDVKYIINVDNRAPANPKNIRARIRITARFENDKVRIKSDDVKITAVFAGLRDDAFLSNNIPVGDDLNVNALVIQMSLDDLLHDDNDDSDSDGDNSHGGKLLLWAQTRTDGLSGKFQDSAGKPALFGQLVGVDPDEFNQTKPRQHVKKFGEQMGLLPDVLMFDPQLPDGFPNGRRLTDVTAGGFPNDVPLLDAFPFMAGPN